MNKPAWLFGTASLLLGGLCLSLLRQQTALSAQPDPKAQSDEVLQAQLAQVRAERDRLETVVNSLRAAPAGAAPSLQPSAATFGAANAQPPIVGPRFNPSPSTRRISSRLRNGKIFRQLGLSVQQIESLLDVLVAQESRASEAKPGTLSASADPELRARNRAELAAVIGNERAQQLEAWQSQMQTRFELRRVRDQLEDSGEPLSDEQLSRISELLQARPAAPLPARQQDETNEAFMGRFKTWRKDNREQLHTQVSSVLDPRQLDRYDDMDELSRELEKSLPMRPLPALQGPTQTAGQAAPPPPR